MTAPVQPPAPAPATSAPGQEQQTVIPQGSPPGSGMPAQGSADMAMMASSFFYEIPDEGEETLEQVLAKQQQQAAAPAAPVPGAVPAPAPQAQAPPPAGG